MPELPEYRTALLERVRKDYAEHGGDDVDKLCHLVSDMRRQLSTLQGMAETNLKLVQQVRKLTEENKRTVFTVGIIDDA